MFEMKKISVLSLQGISLALVFAPATVAQNLSISGSLPNGAVNSAYSGSLSCGNCGPSARWFLGETGMIPPGLSLTYSGASASISGTPTLSGTYTFEVDVFDGDFSAYRSFTITIYNGPTITTPVILPNGIVNQPYNLQLSVTGGTPPYKWTLPGSVAAPNVLPAGMSLSQ